MPMFRSGSQRSTLSMMQRKTTKYQKFLNVSNVLLLVTSTIIIFTAVMLIKFYHISKLDFWSSYFTVVPTYTITLGVYTFMTSFFGFAVSGTEKSILIGSYAAFLAVAFLAQLASIFTCLELRSIITQAGIQSASLNQDLALYGVKPAITDKWDDLQRDMHCCGGNGFLIGYNDYRSTPIGDKFSVPDSCCQDESEGCGVNLFKSSIEQIRNKIHTDGCLTLLTDRLESDVVPMMVIYAVIGVCLALLEVITVVLACAFVAQINRRNKRNNDRGWRDSDRAADAADSLRQPDTVL